MNQRIIMVGLVLAAVTTAAAQTGGLTREGEYWVETQQGVLAAGPGAHLKVISRGTVTVTGDGGNQFLYTVRKRVRAATEDAARKLLERTQFSARTSGDWAYLEFTGTGTRVTGDISVRVPNQLRRAMVETSYGNIEARGLNAEFQAVTGGGQVTADRIAGAALVKTGGGEVRIGSVGGILRASTGGGAIRVQQAGAESWLDTAGGEILVENAGGVVHASTGGGNINIERAEGDVFARTSGGMVTVNQSGGEVRAESAGGGMRIGNAKGVRCESAAGAIHLRHVSGELKAVTAVGSIHAELPVSGGLANSLLSTSSGDITVWIPSNLAVTVKALTEASTRSGKIVSEFPEIRLNTSGEPVASGSLNGGGPVLQLAVAKGTIYLRRR